MNKKELIERSAEKTGLSQKLLSEVLNTFMDTMKESLKNDERIVFIGFGTFKVIKRKARQGFDPFKKESISIPPRKCVKFISSRMILDSSSTQ